MLRATGRAWEVLAGGIRFPLFIMLCLTSWEWWQCNVTEILQARIRVPYRAEGIHYNVDPT